MPAVAHPGQVRALRALFRLIVPHRHWTPPEDARLFTARARDGVALAGWILAPPGPPRGTVLILHGLLRNCTMDGIPAWGRRFVSAGWAAAGVDFRAHGRSADGLPTFGLHEAWDARAALDALEHAGLPRPFVLMGGSLGALAAQRAAYDDARIAGAALIAMPGWPRHGARVGGRAIAGLARADLRHRQWPAPVAAAAGTLIGLVGTQGPRLCAGIARALGTDVIADGDVRTFARPPAHRPRILSVIGDRDGFDWRATWAAWRAWPERDGARPLRTPRQAPTQRRWFVLVPGRTHPPEDDHVVAWEGLAPLLEDFLATIA